MFEEYCLNLSDCIKSRLSWSDLQLMRDIFLLNSEGWEKLVEEENDMAAIDRSVERFATSLEASGADTDAIKTEFCDMIAYTVQYIALSSLDYHSLWCIVFNTQLRLSGQTFLFLLSFFSPFQHQLESWNMFSVLGTIKSDSVRALQMSNWMTYCS